MISRVDHSDDWIDPFVVAAALNPYRSPMSRPPRRTRRRVGTPGGSGRPRQRIDSSNTVSECGGDCVVEKIFF